MGASEKSLSDDATFAGAARRRSTTEMSLGDERTLTNRLSDEDTVIDDIEVVDLEARYNVEGMLGQGGMGAVLLATDTRLGRKVAIKRILGEAARSKTAIMRFLTEAKAIAALNHPNIVQIYDYGRAKDGPFLTMEYVDGGSLLDRCREGALPLEEAVDLACQLCDGLAKAHDAGIVHRDIKPANVLLTKDGLPKLTDFGLAKAEATDHGMTMTGAVMGTPDFMPPEQRRDASEVDARSDLWSLAATVYQMVTGRSPKIIRFNDVPAALQDVLGKALEDLKDSRYQTARELRDALKTSMRAATVAVPDVLEGKCPACGVQNDSSRRFCRGCGESLEAPCLSCDKPMPMWEEICGSCGAKQTPIVDKTRDEMAADQAKAEGLLGDLDFDNAAIIAARLRNEPHPRLSHLKSWSEKFLVEVEACRAEQMQRSHSLLCEALIHEKSHDYPAAIAALESVPPALRAIEVPGQKENVATVLSRAQAKWHESERLDRVVRAAISAKSFDSLLPDIERFLALRPDRSDVKRIQEQLLDRRCKQEASRNDAIARARLLIEQHAYDEAVGLLDRVPAVVRTPELTELRTKAAGLSTRAGELITTIRAAVADKRLDGLLSTIDEYLQIQPTDEAISKLRQSLVTRQQIIETKQHDLITHVKSCIAEHRYAEAQQALEEAPAAFLSPASQDLKTQVVGILARLNSLGERIRAKLAIREFDGLLEVVETYLNLKPKDAEVEALRGKLIAREEQLANELETFAEGLRAVLGNEQWEDGLAAIQKRSWREREENVRDKLLSEVFRVRDEEYQELLAIKWRRDDFRLARAGYAMAAFFVSVMVWGGLQARLYFFEDSAIDLAGRTFLFSLTVSTCLLTIISNAPWFLQCVGLICGGAFTAMTSGGDMKAWVAYFLGCLGPVAMGIICEIPLIGSGVEGRLRFLQNKHGLSDPRAAKPDPRSSIQPQTAAPPGDFVTCPGCQTKVKQRNLQQHLDMKCPGRRSRAFRNGRVCGEKECPRCGALTDMMAAKGKCSSCGASRS